MAEYRHNTYYLFIDFIAAYDSIDRLKLYDAMSSFGIYVYVLKTSIIVYYQNMQGLRSKADEFRLIVLEADYDVVVLTETWLDPSLPTALLSVVNLHPEECA